ncbi:cell division protein Cdc14 [Lipomyces oligophaga]|uniref:cell division protein Cdc14 n=1 Tax=Lipomyces oligophaga TaxID=45792 RepID=UPI0034CF62A8
MESLLSKAFDELSSYDPSTIRHALRNIECLLANICKKSLGKRLSTSNSQEALEDLARHSTIYHEFCALQDNFEWNIALRVVLCLDKLLGKQTNDLSERLTLSALDVLQGVLLLHPNSRKIFAREINMTLLLDLLDIQSTPLIQESAVNTLVCALVQEWRNVRAFEGLDGLATICTLFKRKDTDKEVKLKILEFLFFYLTPEPTLDVNQQSSITTAVDGSMNSTDCEKQRSAKSEVCTVKIRTSKEKQKLLAKYLNNVDSLVHELRQSQPFGNLMI